MILGIGNAPDTLLAASAGAAIGDGGVGMNVLEVAGLPAASVGLTAPEEPTDRTLSSERGETYRKLVLRGGRVVGTVLLGDVEDVGVIAGLVRAGAELDEEGQAALLRGARYADAMVRCTRARRTESFGVPRG